MWLIIKWFQYFSIHFLKVIFLKQKVLYTLAVLTQRDELMLQQASHCCIKYFFEFHMVKLHENLAISLSSKEFMKGHHNGYL